jgi:hypothetical protein
MKVTRQQLRPRNKDDRGNGVVGSKKVKIKHDENVYSITEFTQGCSVCSELGHEGHR